MVVLDIVNNGTETMIFRLEEMIGIVDLMPLDYYKIKQGILQQNLSKYYRFEWAENFVSTLTNVLHTEKGKRAKYYKKNIICGVV